MELRVSIKYFDMDMYKNKILCLKKPDISNKKYIFVLST